MQHKSGVLCIYQCVLCSAVRAVHTSKHGTTSKAVTDHSLYSKSRGAQESVAA